MQSLLSAAVAGLSAGGAYAILGVCAVFTYKLVAVVNFTGAAIGAVGAFVMVYLTEHGMAVLPAVIIGVGAGTLASVLVGLVTTVWFSGSGPSVKAAVTAALLVGIIALGLRFTGGQSPHAFPSIAGEGGLRLANVTVTTASLVAIALALVLTVAVEQFLARTRAGLYLRALSQRPMAAELLGIRTRILALGVWALSGAVTSFALMLIAPTRAPDFGTLSLLVVPAFAAALVGAFQSFRAALVGGLAIGVTKVMARELAKTGVRVNAVAPGFTATPMWDYADDSEETRWAMSITPMGRVGTPREQADACLYLASDESSYVTGQVLVSAGGQYTG